MTESWIGLLDIFTNLSPIRSKRAHCSRGRWPRLCLIGTLSAGAASFAIAENPEMAMDKMTDEELRAFRDQKIIELRAHRRRFHPEQAAEGTLGEDEPRGAVGRQRARPRGTWMEYAFEVEVTAIR